MGSEGDGCSIFSAAPVWPHVPEVPLATSCAACGDSLDLGDIASDDFCTSQSRMACEAIARIARTVTQLHLALAGEVASPLIAHMCLRQHKCFPLCSAGKCTYVCVPQRERGRGPRVPGRPRTGGTLRLQLLYDRAACPTTPTTSIELNIKLMHGAFPSSTTRDCEKLWLLVAHAKRSRGNRLVLKGSSCLVGAVPRE